MKKPPCYQCNDRKQGCHGGCERYLAWSAKGKAAHDAKMKDKVVESFAISNQMKTKEKNSK